MVYCSDDANIYLLGRRQRGHHVMDLYAHVAEIASDIPLELIFPD